MQNIQTNMTGIQKKYKEFFIFCMCISSANPLIFKSTIEEQNRIMYRDPRTDVATMVGATIIAVDKRTTLASEGRSARTEGGQRAARRASIARAAGWARRARPRA